VVDERGEHLLGIGEVLGHAAAGVPSDEGADGRDAERGGGIDAPQDVVVDRLPLGRVGMQVVVVERDRRQVEAAFVEQRGDAVERLRALDVEVGRRERAVAQCRPGGHLQRLVVVLDRPVGDGRERAVR
jgi:hypothetical protein